jgi:hypothetical protein
MREKELDREEATGEGEGERKDRALSRPVTYHVSVRARRQEHLIKL